MARSPPLAGSPLGSGTSRKRKETLGGGWEDVGNRRGSVNVGGRPRVLLPPPPNPVNGCAPLNGWAAPKPPLPLVPPPPPPLAPPPLPPGPPIPWSLSGPPRLESSNSEGPTPAPPPEPPLAPAPKLPYPPPNRPGVCTPNEDGNVAGVEPPKPPAEPKAPPAPNPPPLMAAAKPPMAPLYPLP